MTDQIKGSIETDRQRRLLKYQLDLTGSSILIYDQKKGQDGGFIGTIEDPELVDVIAVRLGIKPLEKAYAWTILNETDIVGIERTVTEAEAGF